MSSPDVVNMMAYIQNGKAFPKKLDPKGTKGTVSPESLIGYSKYTARDNAKENDKSNLDFSPGGYFKYSTERRGSTRTFTNEGWKDTKQEIETFRNYTASIWQEPGRLAWLPVQSFKDYMTASQYGLFNDEDYAQITKNSLNRFFRYAGLNPDNMVWWMNYHNNKNHPHVHVAFMEKIETRTKGEFTKEELLQFKRFMLTEMKTRERAILGTEHTFKNHMKYLQNNKQTLQSRGKEILTMRQDKEIDARVRLLFSKLPQSGRLQYGSSHMFPYRDEIDEIVELVLNHESVKNSYDELMVELDSLDDVYSQTLNEETHNLRNSEIQKIHRVIANAILEQKKTGQYNEPPIFVDQEELEELESEKINAYLFKENELNLNDFEFLDTEDKVLQNPEELRKTNEETPIRDDTQDITLKNQARILVHSESIEDVFKGIEHYQSIKNFNKDKDILFSLSKAYAKVGDNDSVIKNLEQATKLGHSLASYDYAKMLLETDEAMAHVAFKKSLVLMESELKVSKIAHLLKYRIATIHENGYGVPASRKIASDIYKELAEDGNEIATKKFISMTIREKDYEAYTTVQEYLKRQINDGSTDAKKTQAFIYLDRSNPGYNKAEGMRILDDLYNKTSDPEVKEWIENIEGHNYQSQNNQNYSKGGIGAALSAIKQSDAKVKHQVKEGLEEYLRTEKERERIKNAKNL